MKKEDSQWKRIWHYIEIKCVTKTHFWTNSTYVIEGWLKGLTHGFSSSFSKVCESADLVLALYCAGDDTFILSDATEESKDDVPTDLLSLRRMDPRHALHYRSWQTLDRLLQHPHCTYETQYSTNLPIITTFSMWRFSGKDQFCLFCAFEEVV